MEGPTEKESKEKTSSGKLQVDEKKKSDNAFFFLSCFVVHNPFIHLVCLFVGVDWYYV
jgi:hypothetical protein